MSVLKSYNQANGLMFLLVYIMIVNKMFAHFINMIIYRVRHDLFMNIHVRSISNLQLSYCITLLEWYWLAGW